MHRLEPLAVDCSIESVTDRPIIALALHCRAKGPPITINVRIVAAASFAGDIGTTRPICSNREHSRLLGDDKLWGTLSPWDLCLVCPKPFSALKSEEK